MKAFRYLDIDAGELIRNLVRLGDMRELALPIESSEFGHPLPRNGIRAVWLDQDAVSAELPSMLLASENTLADILPRLLALPGSAMPVTSLMKAWPIEDFKQLDVYEERPLTGAATLGFVGIIAGELIATIGANADLRFIGMDGVRRTLSFVCARAVIMGWRRGSLATIMERWLEASVLTGNEVNVPALTSITNICEFLQSLSDLREHENSSPLTLAHQIQSWLDLQRHQDQRNLLQDSLPQLVHTLMGVNSREKRYDLIMEALDQPAAPDGRLHPLQHGFLISLIEPGSFEFLDLAKQLDSSDGAIAIAYCTCAAILGRQSTFSKFNGFGWNVDSQGLRPSANTAMDISLAELRILHNAHRSAPISFRTRSPALIDVELAPLVIGSFGNLARRKTSSKSLEESEMTEREELLRESLASALRSVEDAYAVLVGKKPRQDRKAGTQRRFNR